MLALRLPSKPQVLIMLLGDGDFLNAAYLYLSMFLLLSLNYSRVLETSDMPVFPNPQQVMCMGDGRAS